MKKSPVRPRGFLFCDDVLNATSAAAASPRKRRKMDGAAEDQKASREYPRRGRRATNWG